MTGYVTELLGQSTKYTVETGRTVRPMLVPFNLK